MKKSYLSFLILIGWAIFSLLHPPIITAVSISNIKTPTTTPRVYEKYEVQFDVNTNARYPFFQYDEFPPDGVEPKTGITVEAIINTPSGQQRRHPAFLMDEVSRSGTETSPRFRETGKKYWVLRFSPLETGTHTVTLSAKDASGTTTANVGSFSAQAPVKPGYIRQSSADSRYFEYSNGQLYYPLGPATNKDYSLYVGTGINHYRPWIAGTGAYSTNWARWISSHESLGNEGFSSFLTPEHAAPGSELSQKMFYPKAYRFWLTMWMNEDKAAEIKPNTTYKIVFRAKTSGIIGPRVSGHPYGLVIKFHGWIDDANNPEVFDDKVRNNFRAFDHISSNQDWFTIEKTFTTPSSISSDLSIFLDNVTAGDAYIDQLSIREVLSTGSLGGEQIRNPKADMHTYVDPRGAADIEYKIERAEKYGIHYQVVVHDKNDWIQKHLTTEGKFVKPNDINEKGDGYYQPEDTKARWLLRQWYRYVIARYSYSTAVFSWELNNEGPPYDSNHHNTAEAFAKYFSENDTHTHLKSTSFWCCWVPNFFSDNNKFPNIGYGDIHEYTGKHEVSGESYTYDMAAWISRINEVVSNSNISKPTILAESGITIKDGWTPIEELKQPNPGIWFHNYTWSQLHYGGVSAPAYWYDSHREIIDKKGIIKAFHNFSKDIELNKGGYVNLSPTISNAKLRVIGQKNITKGKAHLWVQNTDYTWKKYMDGIRTNYSGTITINMGSGSKTYTIETWNTWTGTISKTETKTSDGSGNLSLSISSLAETIAFKITGPGGPSPTPTTAIKPGDANGDNKVDDIDYGIWRTNYNQTKSGGASIGDFNNNGKVEGLDYVIWRNNYGK
jgi:hypothetical protein